VAVRWLAKRLQRHARLHRGDGEVCRDLVVWRRVRPRICVRRWGLKEVVAAAGTDEDGRRLKVFACVSVGWPNRRWRRQVFELGNPFLASDGIDFTELDRPRAVESEARR